MIITNLKREHRIVKRPRKYKFKGYSEIRASRKQRLYQLFKLFYKLAGKSKEMDSIFRIEKFSRMLHPLHFSQKNVNENQKTKFFQSQLLGIEIETHAYCNRRCWFCPNAFLNRLDKTQLMPKEIYEKVIDELANIDFRGEVKMQRYNEPLALDLIYERIEYTRKKLPYADIGMHTNGDYLNSQTLKKLDEAGLDHLFVSLYLDYRGDREVIKQSAEQACLDFLSKLKIQEYSVSNQEGLARYKFCLNNLKVLIFAFDLEKDGSDRGGSLQVMSRDIRYSPCMSPFVRLFIDWTGDVFPCCNLRHDFQGHSEYIMGNVKNQSLQEIYFSKQANYMRRHLADISEKEGVCHTCAFDVMCSSSKAKSILNPVVFRIDSLLALRDGKYDES